MENYRFLFLYYYFFKLLPKLTDFINSDDCIRKITLYSVVIKKIFQFDKNRIIFSDKMRNSSNYTYDYAHSFLGNDF